MDHLDPATERTFRKALRAAHAKGVAHGRAEVLSSMFAGLNGDGERVIGKALAGVMGKALAGPPEHADPAPYGYCPECRGPGVMAERRTNGNAHCANGHAYPRAKAKYASTQIDLTGAARRKLLALAARVEDADLGEDGREDDPHVTVRYGLHADSPVPVAAVVRGFGPVRLSLGGLAAFRGAESGRPYDVIYAAVDSPDLHRLNALLAGLPHTDTHDRYTPHATVAYVRAGLADQYLAELGAVNETAEATRLAFCTAARDRTDVPLGVTKSLARPAPVTKAFDESKVVRDDHGRFATKADIEAAKGDPAKAKELRDRVTDPEQRKKLDEQLGEAPADHDDRDEGKPAKGKPAKGKPDAPARPSVDATHALARRLMSTDGPPRAEAVRQLAEAIQGHTHKELADLKARLGIRSSGTLAAQARRIAERATTPTRDHLSHYAAERVTADDAAKRIKEHLAAGRMADPAAVKDVARMLTEQVSVADLRKVKAALGISASGGKAELARKIAERAGRMEAAAEADPTTSRPVALTTDEKNAVRYWVSSSAMFNDVLVGGNKPTPFQAKQIEVLDSAVAKAGALPKPVQAYRGFQVKAGEPSEAFADRLEEAAKAGGVVSSTGFASVTIDRAVAQKYVGLGGGGKPVLLEVKATRGLPVSADVEDVAGAGYDHKQIILPRGAGLRITGVRTEGSVRVFSAEQVGDSPAPAPPDLTPHIAKLTAAGMVPGQSYDRDAAAQALDDDGDPRTGTVGNLAKLAALHEAGHVEIAGGQVRLADKPAAGPAPVDHADPPQMASAMKSVGQSLPSWNGRPFDPQAGSWASHKVLISDLHDAMKDRMPGVGLDDFKAALVRDHKHALHRNDLPQVARDIDAVNRSATANHLGMPDSYHVVDVTQLRPPVAAPAPSPAVGSPEWEARMAEAVSREPAGEPGAPQEPPADAHASESEAAAADKAGRMASWAADRPGSVAAQDASDRAGKRLAGTRATEQLPAAKPETPAPPADPPPAATTHTVPLPKNRKAVNIDTAGAALKQMGYTLGAQQHDLAAGGTMYDVTTPDGRQITLSVGKVRDLVYGGAAGGDPSRRTRKPKAAPAKAPTPAAGPAPAKPKASTPPAADPANPAYKAAGAKAVSDDGFRKNLAAAYNEMTLYDEFKDGLVELPRLWHEFKRRQPGADLNTFHAAIDHLSSQGKVELHVLNEVSQAQSPEHAISRGDRLYYYVIPKRGARLDSDAMA